MYLDAIIRLDFPELFDGAFVELTNPILLPWEKARDVRREAGDDAEAQDRAHLAACIRDWNIPATDGAALPTPVSPADLARAPWVVYTRLVDVFVQKMAAAVPNGEAPSSQPSSPRSRGKSRSPTPTTSSGS